MLWTPCSEPGNMSTPIPIAWLPYSREYACPHSPTPHTARIPDTQTHSTREVLNRSYILWPCPPSLRQLVNRTQGYSQTAVVRNCSQPPFSYPEKQNAKCGVPFCRGTSWPLKFSPSHHKPCLGAHSFMQLSTLKLLNFALITS